MKFKLLILFLFISIFRTFSQTEGEPVDRIIAIVGDEIIMLSDVKSQAYLFAQQNPKYKPDDPELHKFILEQMINERLILTKAKEDSITVTDEEIDQRWEFQLKALIQYYGSEKRIEDLYGMSIARIKIEFRDEIRKSILIEKMKEKKFGNVTVSSREVQEFFENHKDSLPIVPEQVELYHIVKNLETPQNIRSAKYNQALKVRDSILETGDFETFAKRYSDDFSTASSGGELGWVSRGFLFPEFEQVAFALQIKEISPPVETPLGFHLIQLLNKTKDSILVRHILFKITPTSEEIEKAKKFLDSLRQLFYGGKKFEELANQFSDEIETRGAGGYLGKFTLEQIPSNLKSILDSLKEGEVSEPVLYKTHPQESYHIIYKKRIIPTHIPDLTDDYKELEQLAISFKQNNLYKEWVGELRKTIYWEIKN